MILLRELLRVSDHVGCISRLQVAADVDNGMIDIVPFALVGSGRPIGITIRSGWVPTRAQQEFLDDLKAVAGV